MEDDPLANMQARADQCRRLADLVHDRSMTEQLRQWAEDIEADIRLLQEKLGEHE
jgi:hypothetical protein